MKESFHLNEGGRRGHKFKLFKKRVRLNIAKYSFSDRVCDRWNGLPEDIVTSQSMNVFKNRLDKTLKNLEDLNNQVDFVSVKPSV